VTLTLAGQKVLDGKVYMRQAGYAEREHSVQIGIVSYVQSVVSSTVDGKPGQYINQTLQQIGSAVFGKVGIGFSLDGMPPGADKIFPRVSEAIGESRHAFIENLCRMRNIHLIDGGNNNVIGFRGSKGGGLVLKEGYNILHARIIFADDDFAQEHAVLAENHSQDTSGANSNVEARKTLSPPFGNSDNRNRTIVA
jgi:hypothetical protein